MLTMHFRAWVAMDDFSVGDVEPLISSSLHLLSSSITTTYETGLVHNLLYFRPPATHPLVAYAIRPDIRRSTFATANHCRLNGSFESIYA